MDGMNDREGAVDSEANLSRALGREGVVAFVALFDSVLRLPRPSVDEFNDWGRKIKWKSNLRLREDWCSRSAKTVFRHDR